MHPLLTPHEGQKLLLLGNEANVRGALEAGLGFATTYPGTPSSEIADNFFRISGQSDLYFEYSTNEKVALETAAGAAALGNPAESVAWLANKLSEYGIILKAGEIVISGSLTKAVPVQAGDFVRATFGQLGSVGIKFVE